LTYSNLCEAIHSSSAPISLFVSGYLLFSSFAKLRGGKKDQSETMPLQQPFKSQVLASII
jgi:hypothetical protein